ncbi:GL15425 [Drosophila persimilis]|uniref:GL15425 n=1 Tax=Drosophila persimilis TaxID=7234 RepID=B4IQX9_DROPE|nr:GL15425 [Drosophila persimilis]
MSATRELRQRDNATNFVGASRHFSELRRKIEAEADAIREFASRSRCEIAFHTASSTAHGRDFGEAGVKSAKGPTPTGSRKRSPHRRGAGRPSRSGPLSPDPSDGDMLTPGHLLTGGPLIAPPAPRTPDQEGLSCLKRWRLVSSARQMFWQRWSREYVLGLQIRFKWHQEEPNIKEGDLVIVAEDNLPPQQGLLGRVVVTTAGQDGRAFPQRLRPRPQAIQRRSASQAVNQMLQLQQMDMCADPPSRGLVVGVFADETDRNDAGVLTAAGSLDQIPPLVVVNIRCEPSSGDSRVVKFVGRRGCPQRVNCDNATNFVGASRHFSELRRKIEAEADAIREFASRSGCEIAFIPPRAPHMGGLWQAGVKSAKGLLLRAVGSALLTAEELETVLVGIEAVLNSRPLGPLSSDPSDGDMLTPGHLLTGGPLIAPPAPRTPDQEGLSCLKRWRLVSSARQMFWQRWSREYVLGLQIRFSGTRRTNIRSDS